MYWEETIELIKEYQGETKLSWPNLHPSDEYAVYDYERGTVKTNYIPIEDFPEKIKKAIEKYFKYDLYDLQLFCSLGASEGLGLHNDPENVLIICLEGEIAYSIEGLPSVKLYAGDTIFIKKGLMHIGISNTTPRICLSSAVGEFVPKEDVTYYFE